MHGAYNAKKENSINIHRT
jgi:hypothetical protein